MRNMQAPSSGKYFISSAPEPSKQCGNLFFKIGTIKIVILCGFYFLIFLWTFPPFWQNFIQHPGVAALRPPTGAPCEPTRWVPTEKFHSIHSKFSITLFLIEWTRTSCVGWKKIYWTSKKNKLYLKTILTEFQGYSCYINKWKYKFIKFVHCVEAGGQLKWCNSYLFVN